MKFIFTSIIISILAISCYPTEEFLGENILFRRSGSLNDLRVEQLQLQLPNNLFIGIIDQVECDDTYIYILSCSSKDAGVYVFTKSSGEYVGKLGQRGRGPMEYLLPISFSQTKDEVYIVDGGKCGLHIFSKNNFEYIGYMESFDFNYWEMDKMGNIYANINIYDKSSPFYEKLFVRLNKDFQPILGLGKKDIVSGYITGPTKPMFRYKDSIRGYDQFSPIVYNISDSSCRAVYQLDYEGLNFPNLQYLKKISYGNKDYSIKLRNSGLISYYDFYETNDTILSMCIANGIRYLGLYSKVAKET